MAPPLLGWQRGESLRSKHLSPVTTDPSQLLCQDCPNEESPRKRSIGPREREERARSSLPSLLQTSLLARVFLAFWLLFLMNGSFGARRPRAAYVGNSSLTCRETSSVSTRYSFPFTLGELEKGELFMVSLREEGRKKNRDDEAQERAKEKKTRKGRIKKRHSSLNTVVAHKWKKVQDSDMSGGGAVTRRRHLTPGRATPDVAGMFDDYSFLLSGAAFDERYEALGMVGKQNFVHASDYLAALRAQRWEDHLRPEQAGKYVYVDRSEAWNIVSQPLASALATVPVLALGGEPDCGVYKHLSFATYDGYAVTFALSTIAEATPGWLRRAEVLPQQLRTWLSDPNIFIVGSGLAAYAAHNLDGLVITNYIECNQIFLLYQKLGVIHPTFPVAEPDITWLLTYAIGYHHRPSEERRFNYLVGHQHYDAWPEHRHPDWKPHPQVLPTPVEKFFFYYEANASFAFIYRLILHGLVYGGMAAVHDNVDFATLMVAFLQGAGQPKAQARLRDPLGLSTDVGAPSYPPFALRVPVEHAPPPPFPASEGVVDSTDVAGVAPPSSGEVITANITPKKEKVSSPSPDHEMIDLTDQDLVTELDAEVREHSGPSLDGAGQPPADHPGYYTTRGARDRRSPTAPGEASRGIFARLRCRRGQDHRPRSVLKEARGVREHPRATGGNQEPLGPSTLPRSESAPPTYATANADKATLRVEAQAASTELEDPGGQHGRSQLSPGDLRHRLPNRPPSAQGQDPDALPPGAGCAADARCSLNAAEVTAHASAFAAAAGEASSHAYLGSPEPNSGMSFVRRLSARNRTGIPCVIANESTLAAPVDKRALAQPHLNRLEKAWNPYMNNPVFDHRCTVCSSHHCSRYMKGGRIPNCKKWREECYAAPSRRLCDYRRCRRPHQHYTVVCPYLHGRCPKCGARGHDEADACAEHNNSVMSRLREDFEEQANVGLYTRNRAGEVAWGFFPVPPTAPRTNPPFFDYRTVMEKPAAEGMAFVRALVAAEENKVDPPPPLEPDNAFDGGTNPRPLPSSDWPDRNGEQLNPGPF